MYRYIFDYILVIRILGSEVRSITKLPTFLSVNGISGSGSTDSDGERGCAGRTHRGWVRGGGPFEKLRSSLWSEVNVSTGSTEREREREKGWEGWGWLEALSQGYRSVYKLGHSQRTDRWEARKGGRRSGRLGGGEEIP